MKHIVAALFVSLLERLRASLGGQVVCFSNTFSMNMIYSFIPESAVIKSIVAHNQGNPTIMNN